MADCFRCGETIPRNSVYCDECRDVANHQTATRCQARPRYLVSDLGHMSGPGTRPTTIRFSVGWAVFEREYSRHRKGTWCKRRTIIEGRYEA